MTDAENTKPELPENVRVRFRPSPTGTPHVGMIRTAEIRPGKTKKPSRIREGHWLGCLDSNQEWLNQNQLCCQLHHTPIWLGVATPKSCSSYPQPDLNRCWRRERA